MYTIEINNGWNEKYFQILFKNCLDKLQETFPDLSVEQLENWHRIATNDVNTSVVMLKENCPVLWLSGENTDGNFIVASCLVGKLEESRKFVYTEEFINAFYGSFLAENFDTVTQSLVVGSSLCNYLDNTEPQRTQIYGTGVEELKTTDDGVAQIYGTGVEELKTTDDGVDFKTVVYTKNA